MSFSNSAVEIGGQEVQLVAVPTGQTRLVTGLVVSNAYPDPAETPSLVLWKRLSNGDRIAFESGRPIGSSYSAPLKGQVLMGGESLWATAYDYPPPGAWVAPGTVTGWAAVNWTAIVAGAANVGLHANLTTFQV